MRLSAFAGFLLFKGEFSTERIEGLVAQDGTSLAEHLGQIHRLIG